MSEVHKAVFLSYASQDAEAAKRIADALRSSGVEVWFDAEGGLEHGDAWDAKIRRQIKECVLFIPLISANTQAREEGYFRIEWELAAQRALGIATGVAFILPVLIDGTKEPEALVPDRFRSVQWTKLPEGVVPPDVLQRFLKLWSHRTGALKHQGRASENVGGVLHPDGLEESGYKTSPTRGRGRAIWIAAAVAALAISGAAGWWILRDRGLVAPSGITQAIAATPDLSEARKLALRADAMFEQNADATRGDLDLAEQLCKQAIALDPNDAEAHAIYARLLVSYIILYDAAPERRIAARVQAEQAAKLDPDSDEVQIALANFYRVDASTRPEAEKIMRAVTTRRPDYKRAWRVLGNTLKFDGRFDEAIECYEKAATLPGSDPLSLQNAAQCLGYLGRFAEAEAAIDRKIALYPSAVSLVVKAAYAMGRGDLPAADAALALVPASARFDSVVVSTEVLLRLRQRQPARALELLSAVPGDYFESFTNTSPRNYFVGCALALDGRADAAKVAWRAALQAVEKRLATAPTWTLWTAWKGILLERLGESDEAWRVIALYREMAGKQSDLQLRALLSNGVAHRVLAARLRLGDRGAAVDELRELLEKNIQSFRVLVRLDPEFDGLRDEPWFREIVSEADAKTAAGDKPVAAPAPDQKSVAVLAFANLSDDKANEYFSDGISEELLNVLAKVPGLTVRGRSSGFYFKGKQVKSAEIGRQLSVAYLVQGSVRRAGDRVRISAQLIRAATDEVVWSSGSLDRDLKDIFALQDEIAGLIAKNLSVSMGVTARAQHQVKPEALTALLEGRQYWLLRTMEGFARAGDLFRRAVALDPEWAPARAALANLMTIEASYRRGGGESMSDRFVLAAQEARRAIELDPSLGEPHAALGKIAMEGGRLAEAGEEFRRALELEPNNALVRDWYGDLLVTQGRLDLAIVEYQRAADIEPLSPYILWDLAWELMHVRRFREALALVERAAALTPNGALRLTIRRARLLLELGRKVDAESVLRPYLDGSLTDPDPQLANEMIWCLQLLGTTPERERWTAESLRQSPGSFSSGVIHLMRGEMEKAYPLLEKCPPIFWQQLFWDPVFDPVRDSPRFQQVLEKIGCVEQYKVAREIRARLLNEPEMRK